METSAGKEEKLCNGFLKAIPGLEKTHLLTIKQLAWKTDIMKRVELAEGGTDGPIIRKALLKLRDDVI